MVVGVRWGFQTGWGNIRAHSDLCLVGTGNIVNLCLTVWRELWDFGASETRLDDHSHGNKVSII